MARTPKRGLDYFHIDIDIFSDFRIKKLIKSQGGKAFSVYTMLLCNIYKNGYYIEWRDELPFILSDMTGFEMAYISEVLKTCLILGLFDKTMFDAHKILTSIAIQKRYRQICSQCRRVCRINEYNLINTQKIKVENDAVTVSEYSLTIDQEIQKLKADDLWLDQIQVVHHMDIALLQNYLNDFRTQCIADGKERHQSIQDAKRHFNSWLRIIKNKNKDDKNSPKRQNQRRGNILSADEPKNYGNSF